MVPSKGTPHVVYKVDGKRVPGVTTIIGVLAKPALIPWANKMGLQGIDTTTFVDELADAGTLAHDMILQHHGGEAPAFERYSEYQQDLAGNSYASYLAWERDHDVEPLIVEQPMVSEEYRYGGTPDMLCSLDGVATLVDFKTGRALYPEHGTQVAAYKHMLEEQGFAVDAAMILRIGRTEDEGFEVRKVTKLDSHWALFVHCLSVYALQKEINREG